MFDTSLLPWCRGKSLQQRREKHPFVTLQEEMNRAFDNFAKEFSSPMLSNLGEAYGNIGMNIDVSENEKSIQVVAELPGVHEKEIDLSIKNNKLILKGEKKEEREEEKENAYYKECSYGSFHREIPLAAEIDEDNVEATFKNGVLTVKLPKSKAAQDSVKKITVKSS